MKPLMMRWKVVPSYAGRFIHVALRASLHARLPVARPMKFATVIGALSSSSLHWSEPLLVSILATIGPPPLRSFVASASVKLPLFGSLPSCEVFVIAADCVAGEGGSGASSAFLSLHAVRASAARA